MTAVSLSGQSAREQQPVQEPGCWTILGKKIMRLNAVQFFCPEQKKNILDVRIERAFSDCIQQLKEQSDGSQQHAAIGIWAIRHYGPATCWTSWPLDAIDAKVQAPLLGSFKKDLKKLARYSTYAQGVLSSFTQNGRLKPFPEIIFSDAGHANCPSCNLAKERAKVDQEVQQKTTELFFNYFYPNQSYQKVLPGYCSSYRQKLSQLVADCIGQLKGKERFDEQREVLAKWAFESCRVLGFEFTEIDAQSPEYKILKKKFSKLVVYSKVAEKMDKDRKECPRMTILEKIFSGEMNLNSSNHSMIILATERAKKALEERRETQMKFFELYKLEYERPSEGSSLGVRYIFSQGYTDEPFVEDD